MSKKSCEHGTNFNENISPKTQSCEECEKEGLDWVAIRLCSICGHVGCCDSSEGRHATKHFSDTGHPTMIALPNRSWKWCYVHETYI